MKRHDFRIAESEKYGWYICVIDGTHKNYLRKDLKIHEGTDEFKNLFFITYGSASGYYNCRELAENYLRIYLRHYKKEKHNMADNIEITVKVNGVVTPLHKISEQTLLTVRENNKPKEVPVARVASVPNMNEERRLLLKVTEDISEQLGQVIAIDLQTGYVVGHWDERTGRAEKYYRNIQVIS